MNNMNKLILFLILYPLIVISRDYFTIQVFKSPSFEKANEITEKNKSQGFDAFTQIRPFGKSETYLSCINKFYTREEALVFARNLKHINFIDSFEITLVISKDAWISRFIKKEKKEKRAPADTSNLNLNPKNIATRTPASLQIYQQNSFEGTPYSGPIENPVISNQKFVSTDKGLFVSIPTTKGDWWEKVPAEFETKNVHLHFTSDGTLYVDNFKLELDQKKFKPLIDTKKHHLSTYKVTNVHDKDGLLWLYFEKKSNVGLRVPASDPVNEKRVFISSDYGKNWNELPAIIKKN